MRIQFYSEVILLPFSSFAHTQAPFQPILISAWYSYLKSHYSNMYNKCLIYLMLLNFLLLIFMMAPFANLDPAFLTVILIGPRHGNRVDFTVPD